MDFSAAITERHEGCVAAEEIDASYHCRVLLLLVLLLESEALVSTGRAEGPDKRLMPFSTTCERK
jgi:hypothetical protein